MDIESMQKINRLAKELVQHGIFSDTEEATKQAEMMINKGDKSISDVMKLGDLGAGSGTAGEKGESYRNNDTEDLAADLRMLATQLKEQARAINGLKEQLDGLRQEMSKLKTMREQRPVMLKEPLQEQTHLKKEDVKKPEPHPRVGLYEPGDSISVEKFFYSGPPKGD